jgi:50S ribosomal protein L16 3-hydroxylase
MTYSIGFRAPKNQELATEFLGFLQDKFNQEQIVLDGIYQDAGLTLQKHPAEISKKMIISVSKNLQKIKWTDEMVSEFIGTYLSEPKPDVVFEANKKITLRAFSEKLSTLGIALDLKSLMLFSDNCFFLNGEMINFTDTSATIMKILADNRSVIAEDLKTYQPIDSALLQQLYDWYIAGYLHLIS